MYSQKILKSKKTALAGAVALALGGIAMPHPAAADVFTFSWNGAFTMLNSTGGPLNNTDKTSVAPWYGWRTAVTGTVTYDDVANTGGMTVAPFSFFGGGAASATKITLQAIGNGSGGTGSLLLGNMGFNWNGTTGIPVSIVWDATGLFGALGTASTGAAITGTGAVPASNATVFGGMSTYTLPLGPTPVATTTWNTTNIGTVGLGTNPSGTLPLIADTIGGSPMQAGPFPNFNANFDIQSLTVTAIAPSAEPDSASTTPGGTVAINVLSNDVGTRSPIDPTTVKVVTPPANGTTTVNPTTGVITYVNDGVAGADTFTYTVANHLGNASPPATVTLTVSVAGNKPPVLGTNPLPVSTAEAPVTVNLLTAANVSDPDGDIVTILSVGAAAHGTVVNNGNGTVTYTPNTYYNGPDSFTYVADDGKGGQTTGTVNVTVTFVNHAPTANPVSAATPVGQPVIVNVLASATDPDIGTVHGDTLSVQSVGSPAHGTAVNNNNGTVTYTPNSGYSGPDSFTYVVADAGGLTSTGTVTINVLVPKFIGTVTPDIPGAEISPDVSGGSNFTMLNPKGKDIGGTNNLAFTWDGTLLTSVSDPAVNATLASPTPFFGFNWSAHNVQIFGPGTYTFEACPPPINTTTQIAADGSTHCLGPTPLTMVVKPDELGAHMLFDWNGNNNIDVVMVWKINQTWAGALDGSNNFGASGAAFDLAVTDDTADGISGHPMVDGP
ncbi:MAG: Ig-like domain-containing protein, partial [Gammaproteobacteria bacterium]